MVSPLRSHPVGLSSSRILSTNDHLRNAMLTYSPLASTTRNASRRAQRRVHSILLSMDELSPHARNERQEYRSDVGYLSRAPPLLSHSSLSSRRSALIPSTIEVVSMAERVLALLTRSRRGDRLKEQMHSPSSISTSALLSSSHGRKNCARWISRFVLPPFAPSFPPSSSSQGTKSVDNAMNSR